MPTYVITVRGEFVERMGVVADNEEEARQKAMENSGELIDLVPSGDLEVVEIKEIHK